MPIFLSLFGEVVLRSSLVLAVAFALLGGMRRASSSERHLVILFGLLVVAFVPVGLLVSPKLSWTISVPRQVETSGTTQKMTAYFLEDHKNSQPSISPSVMENKPSMMEFFTLSNGFAALIATGMLVQVLLLGRAAWSWQKIRQQAVKALLPNEALERLKVFAEAKEIPPIFASDQIRIPLLAGWSRPAIILPAEAHEWSSQRLVMVLCHEVAHFRRGDSWLLPLICLLRVLYWWHPLVWLALARLRRERENACDDLVLNQNFRATDYADLIIDTARQAHAFHWQNGAIAMASSSDVGERIQAILNPRLNRREASRTMVFTGFILAIVLGWFFVAARVQADDQPIAPNSTAATSALKPQLYIEFKLLEIDEKTYQQQTAAIDEAVKSGDIRFLVKTDGVRVVSSPSVTTQAGLKADISIGKELIQGDKSTPVTVLTATSVLGANGQVNHGILRTMSMGPTKMPLGVNFEVTPSISKDGSILLPIRYRIGDITHYKSPDDFNTETATTDKKLSVVDGQASGFWVREGNEIAAHLYTYSLTSILNSPGEEQIKTLPPLSPSPNRLALIVTARRVGADKTTPVPKAPIHAAGQKPAVDFHIVMVSVDENAYQRDAPAMDEAIRKGDLHFFDSPKDGWVLGTADLNLLVGQPGWYSEGSVQSYIASAKQEVRNGKPWTTLQANAIFLGLNGDFSWSKDRLTLDSFWQLTEPTSYKPLGMEKVKGDAIISPGDLPDEDFHITTHADKAWDMTPGKAHAFWVGETFGMLRHIPMSVDEMIKTRTPSRLAVFMIAQPATN
jgi:beta-lactamase regulating signal transducer with metallopeptidase domain